jgi:hypothetical protein
VITTTITAPTATCTITSGSLRKVC